MDGSDLERANAFSLDRAQSFTDYKPMEDQVLAEEEIIDEEHVHWKVLFVFLAAFICIFLVVVIIATYVDIPARLRSWWVILTGRPLHPPNNANNNSSVDINNNSRGSSLALAGPPVANSAYASSSSTVVNPLSASR
eukprot:scaffold1551_cov164-Ochromonas_danica.AAC.17